MRKVFIPNIASHNYSKAKKYGTLVGLTKGNLDLNNVSKLYREVFEELSNSSPNDLIMISGASVINSLVCSMFSSMHNQLNLLIYCRNGSYMERNLDFSNLSKRRTK